MLGFRLSCLLCLLRGKFFQVGICLCEDSAMANPAINVSSIVF